MHSSMVGSQSGMLGMSAHGAGLKSEGVSLARQIMGKI